jgi:hypothetical protein
MKQITVVFGIVLIAVNLLLGYFLPSYVWHTAVVTSVALGIELMLMLLVSCTPMKDAFRVSLNVLFPLLALIQFVALLYVPQEGYDSVCYVVAAVIFLVQVLLLLAVNVVSKLKVGSKNSHHKE